MGLEVSLTQTPTRHATATPSRRRRPLVSLGSPDVKEKVNCVSAVPVAKLSPLQQQREQGSRSRRKTACRQPAVEASMVHLWTSRCLLGQVLATPSSTSAKVSMWTASSGRAATCPTTSFHWRFWFSKAFLRNSGTTYRRNCLGPREAVDFEAAASDKSHDTLQMKH